MSTGTSSPTRSLSGVGLELRSKCAAGGRTQPSAALTASAPMYIGRSEKVSEVCIVSEISTSAGKRNAAICATELTTTAIARSLCREMETSRAGGISSERDSTLSGTVEKMRDGAPSHDAL